MNNENNQNQFKKIKIISLFNGVSTLYESLRQLGLDQYIERYVSVEYDKFANLVTKARVPGVEIYEDIRDFDGTKFQDFDLCVFGSPCQSISSIGKREEFDGSSRLFYEALRVLNEAKPKYFLMENVNSATQRVKDIINQELGVKGVMLDSSELGSCQRRKRMFWSNLTITPPEKPINGEVFQDILENGYVQTKFAKTLLTGYNCETLSGLKRYLGLQAMGPVGHLIFKDEACINMNAEELIQYYQANSVIGIKESSTSFKNGIFRVPTPLECERLQGLSDNYTLVEGNSNSQRYIQLGNSFNTYHFKYIINQNLDKLFYGA